MFSSAQKLPGPILSGLALYAIQSALAVPIQISIPYSVLVGILVFGLTNLFVEHKSSNGKNQKINNLGLKQISWISQNLFPIFFGFLLLVLILFHTSELPDLYTTWSQFGLRDIIKLVSALSLTLFVPGYAVVLMLDTKSNLEALPRFLLGYILSLLITGLMTFIVTSIGIPILNSEILYTGLYSLILIGYVLTRIVRRSSVNKSDRGYILNQLRNILAVENYSKALIFSCLFAFTFLSTYYLYGNTIVGDQLYHHGRAMLFLTNSYKDNVVNGIDKPYLPLMHSFLAGLFSLAGSPTINVFVSLGFLNIIPIVVFYFFFSQWFKNYGKAATLACTLFVLSSGFGWVYALNLGINDKQPYASTFDAFQTLEIAGRTTFDIRLPNNFLNNGTPTTPLIIFGLPCGFFLLGLIKKEWKSISLPSIIFFSVTLLGIVSHEEFYLFLIISCLLPMLLRLKRYSYFYYSITAAIVTSVFLSISLPGDAFGSREILGLPMPLILLFYVVLTNISYTLLKVHERNFHIPFSKYIEGRKKRLILVVLITLVISYTYLFTFVTWSQLPINDVHAQVTAQGARIVPWYLYPMRFGVVGVLSLAFILSLFFRSYEREVLVLFIIGIIAFLGGPYYNEYRLNKYILAVGVILASLLIYQLLNINTRGMIIRNGLIIGLILVSSGASIILYQGYIALALQDRQINMFMSHRVLPDDIPVLNFLHKNIDLRRENVVLPDDYLYHFRRHQPGSEFAEQIEGFVGIPLENKLTQSSSSLQSSTLEGLFQTLDYGNVKYIVVPDNYVQKSSMLKFIMQNFPIVFKGSNYSITEVPDFTPETSGAKAALILPSGLEKSDMQIPVDYLSINYSKNIDYTNKSVIESNGEITLSNRTKTLILDGENTPNAIWFKTPNGIDFIKTKIRFLGHEQIDNHAGIIWQTANDSYYVYLRSHSIAMFSTNHKEFLRNNNIIRTENMWYDLSVIQYKNEVIIELNNNPVLTFPVNPNDRILRVGLKALNSVAEFSPVQLGKFDESRQSVPRINNVFNYYYPLSMLALSNSNYETLIDGDIAAGSKDKLVLSFDPSFTGNYLDLVEKGKTVIILNSENRYNGAMSKVMGIKPLNQSVSFDEIRGPNGGKVLISSTIREISVDPTAKITSYYYSTESNKSIPLAMSKKFGQGFLVYVNGFGYFSALSKSPAEFKSINKFFSIIDGNLTTTAKNDRINTIPPIRFVGDINLTGYVTVKSNSIYFPFGNHFYAENIFVSRQGDKDFPSTQSFPGGTIENLKGLGPFHITITGVNPKYAPFFSTNSYLALTYPSTFNMTFTLQDSSSLQFYLKHKQDKASLISSKAAVITFKNVKSDNNSPLLIMTKSPDLRIIGETSVQEAYVRKIDNPADWLANGGPLNFQGKVELKIDHVERSASVEGTNYVAYAEALNYGNATNRTPHKQASILLPGDVSAYAKENHIGIPIGKAIFSGLNNKVTVVFLIISAVIVYVSWSRIKKYIKYVA